MMYQRMRTRSMRGTAVTKYHLMLGSSAKVSTFIPKKPTMKVKGKNMKVIQDRRHIDVFSCKECRESLISTLLYMRSGWPVSLDEAMKGMSDAGLTL